MARLRRERAWAGLGLRCVAGDQFPVCVRRFPRGAADRKEGKVLAREVVASVDEFLEAAVEAMEDVDEAQERREEDGVEAHVVGAELDAVANEADSFLVRPAETFESRCEVVEVEVRGKGLREVDGLQIAARVRVEEVPDDALGFGVNVLLSDDEAPPELDRRALAAW